VLGRISFGYEWLSVVIYSIFGGGGLEMLILMFLPLAQKIVEIPAHTVTAEVVNVDNNPSGS